jgi:RNA polymerase sigma-70 factor (ECF subfamily)
MAAQETLSDLLTVMDPDINLMLEVRADRRGAFEELVERHHRHVVNFLYLRVGNAEEAEDLAQEVFLSIYRARKRYEIQAKFTTWLFTIANNLARNALRSRGRRPSVARTARAAHARPQQSLEQVPDDSAYQPTRAAQRSEAIKVVRKALSGLVESQRAAMFLKEFDYMDCAAIAQVMGLSPKAVKSLLCRARVNLRRALGDYHREGVKG